GEPQAATMTTTPSSVAAAATNRRRRLRGHVFIGRSFPPGLSSPECAVPTWKKAGSGLGRDREQPAGSALSPAWGGARSAAGRASSRRGGRRGPRVPRARGGREREDDTEDGPAAWPRAVADGASVSLGHRANDRQAEPHPALGSRPRTVGAVEALEDLAGLSGRHAGALVGDHEHGLPLFGGKPDVDRR